jgi:septal ring factor EnvC (AmiA/AmiB activator)
LTLRTNLQQTIRQIEAYEALAQKLLNELQQDMIRLYKSSRTGRQSLFSARSVKEYLERYRLAQMIIKRDTALFRQYDQNLQELKNYRTTLFSALPVLQRIRAEIEQPLTGPKSLENSMTGNARELRQTFSDLRTLMRQQLAQEKSLADIERNLPGLPLALMGKIIPPISGQVMRDFGETNYRHSQIRLLNSGLDFRAKPADFVYAIADGVVVYESSSRYTGTLLILAHGQQFHTVYSSLSQALKHQGDFVFAGEAVGKAGDHPTRHTPVCHFEIRYNGRAEDPYQWLDMVRPNESGDETSAGQP